MVAIAAYPIAPVVAQESCVGFFRTATSAYSISSTPPRDVYTCTVPDGSGTLTIGYNMFSVPDQLTVSGGPVIGGSVTTGLVSSVGQLAVPISAAGGSGRVLTLTVTANGASDYTLTGTGSFTAGSPVAARPSPNQDPTVTGTVQAQTQALATSQRLQANNLNRRLDNLRSAMKSGAATGGFSFSGLNVTSSDGRSYSLGGLTTPQGLIALSRDRESINRRIMAEPWRAREIEEESRTLPTRVSSGGGFNLFGLEDNCADPEASRERRNDRSIDRARRTFCAERANAAQTNQMTPGVELPDRIGVFVNGQVAFGGRGSSSGSTGFDQTTVGITFGADYRLTDDFVLGLGGGYSRNDTSIDGGGKSDSDGYSVNVYGNFQITDAAYLNGFLSYGNMDFRNSRSIQLTTLSALGKTKSRQLQGSLTAGYEIPIDGFTLDPYFRVSYSTSKIDGYQETGAGSNNLAFDGRNTKSFANALGVRVDYAMSMDFGVLTPYARFEYEREYLGSSNALVRFVDTIGGTASVSGGAVDRNIGRLGAGASVLLPDALSLFLDYETLLAGSGLTIHTFTLGVLQRF